MLTAEQITTTRLWELYQSILLLPVLPPSQTSTRANSLTNNAIQYGTHGMHSGSQFHERYDAVCRIRTSQNPHEQRGMHLASFITYGMMYD